MLSDETENKDEGCLSFPVLFAGSARLARARRAQDVSGAEFWSRGRRASTRAPCSTKATISKSPARRLRLSGQAADYQAQDSGSSDTKRTSSKPRRIVVKASSCIRTLDSRANTGSATSARLCVAPFQGDVRADLGHDPAGAAIAWPTPSTTTPSVRCSSEMGGGAPAPPFS